MGKPIESVERYQQRRVGLIGTAISLPVRIAMLLLASLILSLIFEWIGLAFFWRELGWHHAQSMFNNELAWVSDTFKQSLIFQEPGRSVARLLDWLYQWVFVKSGFIAFTREARINALNPDFLGMASRVYLGIEDFVLSGVYTAMTFVVRVMILTLSIPLFVMAMVVGLVDGLVRRDLRRFGAGRESSFVYHRAKQCITPLLVAPWVIYLALPFSVPPVAVMLPCAVALCVAVIITAATFKKYL